MTNVPNNWVRWGYVIKYGRVVRDYANQTSGLSPNLNRSVGLIWINGTRTLICGVVCCHRWNGSHLLREQHFARNSHVPSVPYTNKLGGNVAAVIRYSGWKCGGAVSGVHYLPNGNWPNCFLFARHHFRHGIFTLETRTVDMQIRHCNTSELAVPPRRAGVNFKFKSAEVCRAEYCPWRGSH